MIRQRAVGKTKARLPFLAGIKHINDPGSIERPKAERVCLDSNGRSHDQTFARRSNGEPTKLKLLPILQCRNRALVRLLSGAKLDAIVIGGEASRRLALGGTRPGIRKWQLLLARDKPPRQTRRSAGCGETLAMPQCV